MSASSSTPTLLATVQELPSIDRLLHHEAFTALQARYGHQQVVQQTRAHVQHLREQALQGVLPLQQVQPEPLAQAVQQRLQQQTRSRLQPIFNLSGTVLHTNLGRALLPDDAVQAVARVMRQPVNLEFNMDAGARGDRDDLIEPLIRELTGAEAVTVVNNNAAAVLLLLNTLSQGRETIVSRGELVEIGGAFRIPDIMHSAGAQLHEVGTTNRTHLHDYERALSEQTALLMKVHCSNYAIQGFTKSVSIQQVAALAHAHGLPAVEDLGSGTLVDLGQWGLPNEPTVRQSLAAGADLVSFSGDKLLGGPQAGLIVGSHELIAQIKRNPLKRALRVGKLTLAALEAVLQLYRQPETLHERLTTLRLFTRPLQAMQAQAERLLPALQRWCGEGYTVGIQPVRSQIGSGALPDEVLPSVGLRIDTLSGGRNGRALLQLEQRLRALPQPVIGRLHDNALWLDVRCLEPEFEAVFLAQLVEVQS